MSLFFERRAFCSHLCFLGGLSGNYSMTSSLAFRANQDNCKKVGCKDLWCANGSERAAACPLYETPRTMDSNRDCNMCGNCVKSCPHGSLRLEVRKPTSEFWNIRKPRLDVAFLAIVLVGVVIVQNLTMLGIYPTILAQGRVVHRHRERQRELHGRVPDRDGRCRSCCWPPPASPRRGSAAATCCATSRSSATRSSRWTSRRTWRTTSSTCSARASRCRARSCSGWAARGAEAPRC